MLPLLLCALKWSMAAEGMKSWLVQACEHASRNISLTLDCVEYSNKIDLHHPCLRGMDQLANPAHSKTLTLGLPPSSGNTRLPPMMPAFLFSTPQPVPHI